MNTLDITIEITPRANGRLRLLHRYPARAIVATACYRGAKVEGLPGLTRTPPIYRSSAEAVEALHRLADAQEQAAKTFGSMSTASGQYMLARAAYLRAVARVLLEHRAKLWPAEEPRDDVPWVWSGMYLNPSKAAHGFVSGALAWAA